MHCGREGIRLPNELLSVIINELTDKRTLASCRLASHVLCSLATPLSFSSISLELVARSPWQNLLFQNRTTKLKQLLTLSNDIAASIHTFKLTLNCENEDIIAYGTLISEILHRLPHIRNFTLNSEHCTEFSSIPEDFLSMIQALCRSPNLTTLDISGIQDFPITVITACPNLRCLRLLWVSLCFDNWNVNPMHETSSPQLLYLDSLELDSCSIYHLCDAMSNKLFTKYFSRIKNLRLNLTFFNDALRFGWDIILLVSQNLTTLDISSNGEFISASDLEPIPYDLDQLPALRNFKIQLLPWLHETIATLSLLRRLLSSSTTSGIETLDIEIILNDDSRVKNLFSSDADWSALDEVLTGEKFVSLRKVILGFTLEREFDGNKLECKSLILSYVDILFPMLRTLTSRQCMLETYVEVC